MAPMDVYGSRDRECVFHRQTKDPQEFKEAFDHFLSEVERGVRKELDCTRFIFAPYDSPQDAVLNAPAYFERCYFDDTRLSFFFEKEVIVQASKVENVLDMSGSTFHAPVKFSHLSGDENYLNLSNSTLQAEVLVEASSIHYLDAATIRGSGQLTLSNLTLDELHLSNSTFDTLNLSVVETRILRAEGTQVSEALAAEQLVVQEAKFDGAHLGKTKFHQCRFKGAARFDAAHIGWGSSFDDNRFDGVAFFRDIQADGRPAHDAEPWFSFRHVSLSLPDGVEFSSTRQEPLDVGRVSFTFTDVAKIRFQNVTWLQAPSRLNWIQRRQGRRISRVFDEDLISPPEGSGLAPLDPEYVRDVYKGLRRSYELGLKYAEAGAFHVREMEMKFFAKGGTSRLGRVRRAFSFRGLYRFVSWYGEDYVRAFWMLLAWVAIVAGMHAFVYPHLDVGAKPWIHVREGLNALLPSGVQASSIRQFFERVIGLTLVTLFILALRRNFKR